MAERKGQVFVDDLSEELSCTYNGFCGASEQEVGVHVTCRFRVDLSIILKFIALRVEARGMVRLFCRQSSILLYWILPTIAKLGKMPL